MASLNAPVADLIGSSFGTADTIEIAFAPIDSLPVKRLTLEGIARGWNWPAAFDACGQANDQPANSLFAHYVGAGLREMGVSNLAQRLCVTGKRERKLRQQMDLVAQHANKLLALDLKLRPESLAPANADESMTVLLRQALDTRKRLAGLAVQMVLVRPCRLFPEAERDLAKAIGIEVIDQRDAPRLFSRLGTLLEIPALPAEMIEVEAMLVQQIAERGRLLVFGAEGDRLRQQEADSGGPEWVDIEAYLNRVRTERGQNWLLWANATEICLRLERPAHPPAELPNLIQTALRNFGRCRVESTPNGYEVIFPREGTRFAELRQALAGFVNRRLETMVFVQVRPSQSAPAAPPVRSPRRPARAVVNPPPAALDYGSLDDLEVVVDQAIKPKTPGNNAARSEGSPP
jgi:hypothetical protein